MKALISISIWEMHSTSTEYHGGNLNAYLFYTMSSGGPLMKSQLYPFRASLLDISQAFWAVESGGSIDLSRARACNLFKMRKRVLSSIAFHSNSPSVALFRRFLIAPFKTVSLTASNLRCIVLRGRLIGQTNEFSARDSPESLEVVPKRRGS